MPRSDTSPVWKRIYPIIYGKSPNITPDVVRDMLKLCRDKIVAVFLEYKPYTRESLNSWTAEPGLKDLVSDDEMRNFINNLAKELDLDVSVAWTIICNFLMFEYFGKVDELKTLIKYDSKIEYLTENIWYFYTSDRMFLLKTLRHIFESVHDKTHVYFREFDSFIKSINISLLWKNLVKVFENLIGELDRDKAQTVSEDLVVQWVHRNNREQAEVVLLLMHTLQYHKVDGSELEALLILFIRHGFSRHPLYQRSLNISRPNDLLEVKNAEVALVLAIAKSYWGAPGVAKLLPTHVEKNLELLQIQGDNTIVLFAWSILKTFIGDGTVEETHLEYCNSVAVNLVEKKVFESIHKLITHRMFSNCKVGEIAVDAVYTLVIEFTKICADFSYLHEQAGVSKVTAELLKRKGTSVLESLGPIFQLSMEAFPFVFEPFLEMCKSLLMFPEKYHAIMKLLKSIPGFLAEIPWNDHRRRFKLGGTQRLFLNSDLFTIPEGTVVESFLYQGTEFARFLHPFSFFTLMEQFTTSLSTINFEVGTEWYCFENLCQLVTIGFRFISHLLKHYKGHYRTDRDMKKLVQLLDIVPGQFADGPGRKIEFVFLYFEIHFTLITREMLDYMEAFPPIQRKKCLPARIGPEKTNKEAVSDLLNNRSLLFQSLKEEEGRTKHSLLIEYLKLLEFMVKKNIYHREVQLAGVWYIINCVYPVYQQWNYDNVSEEIAISKYCSTIFVCILQRHLSKVKDDSIVIFNTLLDSLLHQEVMAASFMAMFTKDKFYLQNLMEQESNWINGPCVEYLECTRLQLAMILLLFKHKSRMPNVKTTLDEKIGIIVKSVSAYILNPYSIPLKKLACRFLEFLARDKNIPLMALLGLDYDQVQRLYLDKLRDSTEDDDLKICILDLIGTCILSQHGMTAALFNVKRPRKWYSDSKEQSIEGDTVCDFMIDYLQNIRKSHEYLRSPLQIGILHVMANLWISRKRHLIEDVIALEPFWPLLADPLFRDFDQAPCVYTHIFKICGIQLIDDVNSSRFLSSIEKFSSSAKQVRLWMEYVMKKFKDNTTNFEDIEDRKSMLRSWMEFVIMLEKTPELRKFPKECKYDFIMNAMDGVHIFMVNTYCLDLWMDFCLLQLSYWGVPYSEKYPEVSRKAINMLSVLRTHYTDFPDSTRLTILSIIQHLLQNLKTHFEVFIDELMELLEQFGTMLEYEYELTKDRFDEENYYDAAARERLLPWMMCVRIANGLFEFESLEEIALWFSYRNFVQKLADFTCELLKRSQTLPLAKVTLYSMCLYAESPLYLDFMNINMKEFLISIEDPLTILLNGNINKFNIAHLEEGWTTCTLVFKFLQRLFQSFQYSALPNFYTFITFYEHVLTHIFSIPETTVALKALDLIINTLMLFDNILVHWQLEWYRKSNDTYNFVLKGVKKIINACLYTLLRPKNIIVYLSDQYNKLNQLERIPVDLMVGIMNKLIKCVCLGFSILYKVNPSLIVLLDVFIPDTMTVLIENDFSVPKFELPIGNTLTYGMLLCLAHFFCKTLDALNSKKDRENKKTCEATTEYYSRYLGLVEHQYFSDHMPNQKLSAFLRYAMYEYSGLADPWIEKLDYNQVKKSLECLMLFLAQQIYLAIKSADEESMPFVRRNLSSELQFFYEHIKKHTSVMLSELGSRSSLTETDILKRYLLQCKASGDCNEVVENNFCLIILYWFTNICRLR